MSADNHQSNLISVIMPCYNSDEHVANSIRSALNQTYRDIELVIVDDGSTDNSQTIISSFDDQRIRFIKQDNKGVCVARNTALKEAQGEYIAFLDSDDTWASDCLEKLYSALHKDHMAAMAYCGWQNVGVPGPGGAPFIPPDYERPDKATLLLQSCRWPIHAALTRHKVIKKFGGFDERFKTAEDFYLWLRIGTFYKIVLVPEILAFYLHHAGPQASKDLSRLALDKWFAQRVFIHNNQGYMQKLGKKQVRLIVDGGLLQKGYECYWKGQLEPARDIFRFVMRIGYGGLRDWMHMLPCLLPVKFHCFLLKVVDKNSRNPHAGKDA